MKLKPCEPSSQSGLSQCVTPSLMPGDRGAEAGLLDEQRLVERREVVAVDRGGDREQTGMAVDAQLGLAELQRAEDEIDDLLGRVRRRRGLEHLHRVAAIGEAGAAHRIAERLRPEQGRRLAVGGDRTTPLGIEFRPLARRQAIEHTTHIGFDLGEFLDPDHALEDVEAATPIGVKDVRMHAALRVEADRPAIAQGRGALRALCKIGIHRRLLATVVDRARLGTRWHEVPPRQ
jgi:hypothetical protein